MLPTSSRPFQGSARRSIPRLATLGWGYLHLWRDAPDLFEAVSGFCVDSIPSLASLGWGFFLHLYRVLPTSSRPFQGAAVVLFSGSLRSAGVTCISVEMLPTSSRPFQGSARRSIPRLASLGWGYLHLFEMLPTSPRPFQGSARRSIPRLASLGWGYASLFEMLPDLSRPFQGCCSSVLSPGSLRSAGVTCISVEMLPSSSRPFQGAVLVLSPGSLRSAVTCITVGISPIYPYPSLLKRRAIPWFAMLASHPSKCFLCYGLSVIAHLEVQSFFLTSVTIPHNSMIQA